VADIEFEAFFTDRYDEVRRALTVAFGDARLAEDCAQEAFVRAFVRWKRIATMDNPAGWVYVVATNIGRRRRPWPAVAVADAAPAADFADAIVDRASIAQGIQQLPDRQRVAVVLRYLADLSIADVAAAMGCAQGTVKSTLHSALARLRVALAETEEVPDATR
jgi:RNA polymerase sigma-70 factor (ECF subfamily)